MVLVYDVALREKITSISFEEERYTYVPTSVVQERVCFLYVCMGILIGYMYEWLPHRYELLCIFYACVYVNRILLFKAFQ